MALRDIVLYPSEVLVQKATSVEQVTDEVKQLVDDMIATMYDAPGIGIAAPQVGVLDRVTVIDISSEENPEEQLHVFINPEIVHAEGTIIWEEGCLSIPGIYEKVERSNKVVVQALNRDGAEFELEAHGLLAVALQHEIDHLNGVLFLDHLSPLKRRMAMKKYRKVIDGIRKKREEAKQKQESEEQD